MLDRTEWEVAVPSLVGLYSALQHLFGDHSRTGVNQAVSLLPFWNGFHYEYVKTNDRYKDLEWALDMEFNRQCRVRLVPPNAIPQTQNPSKF